MSESTTEHQQITQRQKAATNVGDQERLISIVSGGLLALYGLSRSNLSGFVLTVLGGGLVYRGAFGHSIVYNTLDINTAHTNRRGQVSVAHNRGTKIEKTVTINKSPEEIYKVWRDFVNLPTFIKDLILVEQLGENRFRWVMKSGNDTVQWQTEVIADRENERIAWRSLEGSDVDNACSIHFEKRPDGRGTQVKIELTYDPPGGKVGAALAKLTSKGPFQEIVESLRQLKQMMEAGELATTVGQPSGYR